MDDTEPPTSPSKPDPAEPPRFSAYSVFVPIGLIFVAASFVFFLTDLTNALAWSLLPVGSVFLIVGFVGLVRRRHRASGSD